MPIEVSDKMSNLNDQIVNAAKVLGRSKARKRAFEEVYRGKKGAKTKTDLLTRTDLREVRLLQVLRELQDHDMVARTRIGNQPAFRKLPFYSRYKKRILAMAGNKKALSKVPTKTNPIPPKTLAATAIAPPKKSFDVRMLTIDEIDSFNRVRKTKPSGNLKPIEEARLKSGFQKILNENGTFKDWGGEKNDLFSTRLQLQRKRIAAAFAFKGKGKKGVLRPNMLGKNGDQIPRLFDAKAEIYILQYWGQIHESVYELMQKMAIATSAQENRRLLYCIIDGQDTVRLMLAYSKQFK